LRTLCGTKQNFFNDTRTSVSVNPNWHIGA
jgi:hypothetical protein